jgi:hypothetical protein
MCHAVIGRDYWPPIYESERLAKERLEAESRRKAEEWERARPERERKAAEARQKAEQAAIEAQRQAEQAAAEAQRRTKQAAAIRRSKKFSSVYYSYLLPILSVFSGQLVVVGSMEGVIHAAKDNPSTLLMFVPALNWLAILGLLTSKDGPLALKALVFWGLAGLALGYAIRKS